MPELPEVEVLRLGLAEVLPGLTIQAVDVLWPKSFQSSLSDLNRFLLQAKVVAVTRRAKVLLIELHTKYSLAVHLKMTGQLVYRSLGKHFGAGHPNDSLIGELPDRSTRVVLRFTNGGQLFFNDQRKFGWMRLLPTAEIQQIDFFKSIGPEPLHRDFSWRDLNKRLQKRPKSIIKAVLLDQSIVAGLGNIYSDESLWEAKIHPSTRVQDLTPSDVKRLHDAIVSILRLSITKGGSTDRTYVDMDGKKGSYLQFARVFRRQGQPCPRCGTTIMKIRVAGRGTHVCLVCQKEPKG